MAARQTHSGCHIYRHLCLLPACLGRLARAFGSQVTPQLLVAASTCQPQEMNSFGESTNLGWKSVMMVLYPLVGFLHVGLVCAVHHVTEGRRSYLSGDGTNMDWRLFQPPYITVITAGGLGVQLQVVTMNEMSRGVTNCSYCKQLPALGTKLHSAGYCMLQHCYIVTSTLAPP